MWSWWDCMQWWWGNAPDGSVSWLVFLPMMFWPILVISGIIALVVLLLRGSNTSRPSPWHDSRTPFDILRERFARGEIDRQEYEERKGLLSQP